jgi:hypothetical protein
VDHRAVGAQRIDASSRLVFDPAAFAAGSSNRRCLSGVRMCWMKACTRRRCARRLRCSPLTRLSLRRISTCTASRDSLRPAWWVSHIVAWTVYAGARGPDRRIAATGHAARGGDAESQAGSVMSVDGRTARLLLSGTVSERGRAPGRHVMRWNLLKDVVDGKRLTRWALIRERAWARAFGGVPLPASAA